MMTERNTKAPAAPASRLTMAKRGRLDDALRYMFYGPEGVGKSTLAANAPDPIWFDCEDGSGLLDVTRYPFRDGPGGHVPRSLAEIRAGIRDLATSDHAFKTLVLDTADRLESLLWLSMLERDSGRQGPMNKHGKKLESIEEYGFGKGYVMAVEEWRALAKDLDDLRSRKQMSIVILGHARIRQFKNPAGEDYDRWQPRIDDKAGGFLKEWCDVVGFVCWEEGGMKLSHDQQRAKGYSTGKRFIKLERTAAYDAKTRIPTGPQVELSVENPWAPLATALAAGRSMPADQIIALIKTECARIGDDALTDRVRQACAATTDTAALGRYLMDLKRRNPATESDAEDGAAR